MDVVIDMFTMLSDIKSAPTQDRKERTEVHWPEAGLSSTKLNKKLCDDEKACPGSQNGRTVA